MTDAVLQAFDGQCVKADDHSVAARELRELCAARQLDTAGLRHLEELVGNKNRFSYGDAVVRDGEFKRAKLRMEQFFKWVYTTFPELARSEEEGHAQSI